MRNCTDSSQLPPRMKAVATTVLVSKNQRGNPNTPPTCSVHNKASTPLSTATVDTTVNTNSSSRRRVALRA